MQGSNGCCHERRDLQNYLNYGFIMKIVTWTTLVVTRSCVFVQTLQTRKCSIYCGSFRNQTVDLGPSHPDSSLSNLARVFRGPCTPTSLPIFLFRREESRPPPSAHPRYPTSFLTLPQRDWVKTFLRSYQVRRAPVHLLRGHSSDGTGKNDTRRKIRWILNAPRPEHRREKLKLVRNVIRTCTPTCCVCELVRGTASLCSCR